MYLLYGYFGLKRTFCPVNKQIKALTDKMSFQFYLRMDYLDSTINISDEIYLDILKDRLYTSPTAGNQRRSAQPCSTLF